MADFCQQCSKEVFGKDHGDLKGCIEEMQVKRGFAATALCEHCGFIQVDHEGKCLTHTDKEHENMNKEFQTS